MAEHLRRPTMKSNAASNQAPDLDYPDHLKEMLEKATNPKKKYLRWATQFPFLVVAAIILYWSGRDTDLSTTKFIQGIPSILDYI